MNPLFFGTSEQPLFGVYHPPRSQLQDIGGVVLCYPFGQEYMRAHRAFRQLALLLTKAGFHVFRFDYFGTGDSAGESSAGSIEQWMRDVDTAIEELKDTADIPRVSIVGLRLGASIGALAAADRADVDTVVLWDPVIDGAEYAGALIAEGIHHESYRSAPVRGDAVSVLGFPLTPAMQAGLESLDLHDLHLAAGIRAIVVVSEESAEYVEFDRQFCQRHDDVDFHLVPASGNWNEVDDNGSALIPQAVIRDIVASLTDASAGRP
ncbi:MAG: alpha/beta hydrolase [Gemmatimonadaceae bacterium]